MNLDATTALRQQTKVELAALGEELRKSEGVCDGLQRAIVRSSALFGQVGVK